MTVYDTVDHVLLLNKLILLLSVIAPAQCLLLTPPLVLGPKYYLVSLCGPWIPILPILSLYNLI